eukprot:gb/GECG01004444.1/.p1 GENE.gb/GECG01004444.1/~~gb/GECG01004444.1/.p1  ORF type:complete len:894 (+),score=138.76 gb/GECG01004444.1/:1-2682(+)
MSAVRSSKGREGGNAKDQVYQQQVRRPAGEATPSTTDSAASRRKKAHVENVIYGSSIDVVSPGGVRSIPKSAAARELLLKTLSDHFFFCSLTHSELEGVVDAMWNEQYEPGDTLVRAHQVGDTFYVIESGEFSLLGSKVEIERRYKRSSEGEGTGGSGNGNGNEDAEVEDAVFVEDEIEEQEEDSSEEKGSLRTLKRGDCYGELALMQDIMVYRTIVCDKGDKNNRDKASVWHLNRGIFRRVVASAADRNLAEIKKALQQSPLLQDLTISQISKVAMAAKERFYQAGETIIRKGDPGDFMLFIRDGSVRCTDIGSGARTSDVVLGPGACVGERALVLHEARAANVIAETDTTCFELSRNAVKQLLGSLSDVLDHNMAMNVLRSVPVFRALTNRETADLASELETKSFHKGDKLAIKDEKPSASEENMTTLNSFMIIREGKADVVQDNEVQSTLESGDYFGERQLLSDDARETTIVGSSDTVTCLTLSRAMFDKIVGSPSSYLLRLPPAILESAGLHSRPSTAQESSTPRSQRTRTRTSSIHRRDSGDVYQGEDEVRSGELDYLLQVGEVERPDIDFNDLEKLHILGIGTFGRVYMVRHTKSGALYALKVLRKAKVMKLKQQRNVVYEKAVMAAIRHPFLLHLYNTYMDDKRLYMLLELVQGGELFNYLDTVGLLDSESTKFYSGCVFAGIAHLHEKCIVYRDLKPENLLLDTKGYIRIVDFGFAKHVPDRTYTLCGTPDYFAPEMVLGNGYRLAVDWWALGILIFEMLAGESPFADEDGDQMAIYRAILKGRYDWPDEVTDEQAKDLVSQLLQSDVVNRLGCRRKGPREIAEHPWFSTLNWRKLMSKELPAPWVPELESEDDVQHFEEFDDEDSGEDDDEFLAERDMSWCDGF